MENQLLIGDNSSITSILKGKNSRIQDLETQLSLISNKNPEMKELVNK